MGPDLAQSGIRGKAGRLVTILDRNLCISSGQCVQKRAPVVPGRAAARVAALVYERTDRVESLDLVGMLTERELDLGLLDHGVDAPAPVCLAVGQQVEVMQRIV